MSAGSPDYEVFELADWRLECGWVMPIRVRPGGRLRRAFSFS